MTNFKFTKKNKLLVLCRMRELIGRPKGWTKGFMKNWSTGAVCLLGAEREALAEMGACDEFSFFFLDGDGEKLSIHKAAKARGFRHVTDFNDAPKTRKKDVLSLIDEKIAELS